MTITVFSDRYYPEDMKNFDTAVNAVHDLSDIMIKACDAWYYYIHCRGERKDVITASGIAAGPKKDKLYAYLLQLGLNNAYANALEPYVKGIVQSIKTRHDEHIKDIESEIEDMTSKVAEVQQELAKKQAVKNSIRLYAKTKIWNIPYEGCTIRVENGTLTGFRIKEQPYTQYELKVEKAIRDLKGRIARIKEGIKRREHSVEVLKSSPPPRPIFGSRKLYRQKDTVYTAENRKEWAEKFDFARHSSITLSGYTDSQYANRIVKWDPVTHDLTWELPKKRDEVIPDEQKIVFPNFRPRRMEDDFIQNFSGGKESRHPVTYTLEMRIDEKGRTYFLIKITFKLIRERLNFSIDDGVIAVDINADRLAWANLDANRRKIATGVIPMPLYGKTSNQVKDIIGRASLELIKVCINARKPLVMEDLDAAAMRRHMKYKNKKRNRIISGFACQKIILIIKSQAYRNDIGVFTVDPKYTSFIGKICHMRKYGISVHEAAAIEIGCRLLGNGVGSSIPEDYENLKPKRRKSKKKAENAKKTAKSTAASSVTECVAANVKETLSATASENRPDITTSAENSETSDSTENTMAGNSPNIGGPSEVVAAEEKPESEYAKYYREWKSLYNALKGIRPHAYYLKVPVFKNKKKTLAWFKDHDRLHPEFEKQSESQKQVA